MTDNAMRHLDMRLVATLAIVIPVACGSTHGSVLPAASDSGQLAADAATHTAGDSAATATDGASSAKNSATGGVTQDSAATSSDAGSGGPANDSGGPSEVDAGTAQVDAGGAPQGKSMWAVIHKEIIVAKGCGGDYCHGKGGAMSPDPDISHSKLMMAVTNKPKCKSSLFITPGKPEESLFYLKIAPGLDHGCGDKMPKGSDGLPPELSGLVKEWIKAGAKKD